MKEESNLSEKIKDWDECPTDFLLLDDVREFIKRLKNIRLSASYSKDDVTEKERELAIALFQDWHHDFLKFVDKLAGEKLI